ncbi:MAG: ketoacyl-ACP synthase III [Candidatus Cloacimonetes bacterium]|nr:ketoacyl-ACP synthase III [Candidatus Cloacimonadota bacterium]
MKYRAMIDSVGHYVPKKIVNNFDLEKKTDTNDEWIKTRTGMFERHYVDDTEAASDLAFKATENAIYSSNTTTKQDIDMIIVATVTSDHPFPATACILQKRLGLKDIPAFDICAGCSGFIYALDIAKQYIENGIAKTILVVGVEILSQLINWADRGTNILFGDGAGAAIITRTPSNCISHIIDSKITADGTDWELLLQVAGGSRIPASPDSIRKNAHTIYMEGNKIFKLAVRAMSGVTAEVLKRNNVSTKDIDWVVPHQANLRIIESVAEKLNIPMSRMIVTIDKFANTSSASVPITISVALKQNMIKRGDMVVLTAFGAGLTFGTVLLRY